MVERGSNTFCFVVIVTLERQLWLIRSKLF